MELVCKNLSNWLNLGKIIKIDINFSYITLIENNITEVICSICDKYEIPYYLINIEIADNKNLVTYETIIQKKLKYLVKKGFSISIDNFCFEFTTLNTVINTDITEVKLGQSLITNIDKSPNMQVALRNIVDMCNNIKHMNTVALGVETTLEANCIKTLGPTHVQGFNYCEAITFEEFYEKFIK